MIKFDEIVKNKGKRSVAGIVRGRMFSLLMVLSVLSAMPFAAQAQTEDANVAYYKSLIPRKDTLNRAAIDAVRRNTFWKRLSLHTNVIDWATLVPNVGIECDIDQFKKNPSMNDRTHYSVMLTGKYNGFPTFGKFVYGVGSVRLEGRKYWRTGSRGASGNYHYYKKLNINKKSAKYNGDSLRSYGYNVYQKARRNIFSGRTMAKEVNGEWVEDTRYWRAYYIGAWFSYDKFDICCSGKGKRGDGLAGGVSFGYDIPLLPQSYPKEGSLDLELGLNVGIKGVKCDSYRYNSNTAQYDVYESSSKFTIVPYPVIQDIHASLVWRVRSIKNKVDLSLVDDYQKQIDAFEKAKQDESDRLAASIQAAHERAEAAEKLREHLADSTKYADYYNTRRLKSAMLLNPDTVFVGQDYKDYMKLIKGIDPTPKNLKKAEKQQKAAAKAAAKASAKEEKKGSKK